MSEKFHTGLAARASPEPCNYLAINGEHLVTAGFSLQASSNNKPADILWNFVGMVADASTIVSVCLPSRFVSQLDTPLKMTECQDRSSLCWWAHSGATPGTRGGSVKTSRGEQGSTT